MRITVTERDIMQGARHDGTRCPISLAARRSVSSTVHVFSDMLACCDGERDLQYKLPQEAIDFVERFDMGRPVQPFEFVVESPEVFILGDWVHED